MGQVVGSEGPEWLRGNSRLQLCVWFYIF